MCQRTRLHLQGGFYFLCTEHNDCEPRFFTRVTDYRQFENLLADTLRLCEVRVRAYCWEARAIPFGPEDYLLPFVRHLHSRAAIGVRGSHVESSHPIHLGRVQKPWVTVRKALWSLCGATDMHTECQHYMCTQSSSYRGCDCLGGSESQNRFK